LKRRFFEPNLNALVQIMLILNDKLAANAIVLDPVSLLICLCLAEAKRARQNEGCREETGFSKHWATSLESPAFIP